MRQKDVWGIWHCAGCKSLGLIVEIDRCCAIAQLVTVDQESDKFAALPAPLPFAIAA